MRAVIIILIIVRNEKGLISIKVKRALIYLHFSTINIGAISE